MFRFAREESGGRLAAALLAAGLLGTTPAGANVGVTQGEIVGTITLDADFVPDWMDVDAGDVTPPHSYQSHGSAVLQSVSSPAPGRQVSVWSYDLPVEAQAAGTYRVRPTAHITALNERAPFPDSADVSVSVGATTAFDVSYRPVVMTGSVSVSDLAAKLLPLRSVLISAYDVTGSADEVVQPDCVGSVAFCKSASQVWASVPGTYRLYLHPGHAYVLNPQAISVNEDPAVFGADAYNAVQFNDGEPVIAPAAAADVNAPTPTLTKDYVLTEVAEVSGQLSLNVPAGWSVFGRGVTLQGTTLQGRPYSDLFFPSPYNPSPGYLLRAFDVLDFAKPISLVPSFQLSASGNPVLAFPAQPISLAAGEQKTVDLGFDAGVIAGQFTFNPAYRVKSLYPGVQVQSPARGLARNVFTPDAANGGHFQLLAYPDTWSYWSMGWDFDLSDPAFSASYQFFVAQIGGVTMPPGGGTVNHDLGFDVDLVKVFFSAPDADGLSDPQLTAVAAGVPESGQGAGLAQSHVQTGEARVVLRVPSSPTAFTITPSAVLHGARVNFSPIILTPEKNHTYVIGTPGNIVLSVDSPAPGATSASCQFQVQGSAGGMPIIGITVDGQPVAFTASPSATDANRVVFDVPVTDQDGVLVITATGSAAGKSYQVSETVAVSCPSQPPVITQCPAAVTVGCAHPNATATLTAGVSDPNGGALTVNWSVDGVLKATHTLAAGATSDSFTFNYGPGTHTVDLQVANAHGGSVNCSTTVKVQSAVAPTVKASVATDLLWPPNFDLVNVGLSVATGDACDAFPAVTVKVFSDEADMDSCSSAGFSPDAKNLAAGTLRLRAERRPQGDGRIYLVVVQARDSLGLKGGDVTSVVVPHDQSKASVNGIKADAAAAVAYYKAHGTVPHGFVEVGTGPKIGPKQ